MMEIAALIGACSRLVEQFDAHRIGAVIFLCVVALVVVGVLVVAIAATLRAALAARGGIRSARVQRNDERPSTKGYPQPPASFSQGKRDHRAIRKATLG